MNDFLSRYLKSECYERDFPKEKVGKLLPWVDVAISNTKRMLLDIHHNIKPVFLLGYLNEFCYKFNRRYFAKLCLTGFCWLVHHQKMNLCTESGEDKKGNVLSPRMTLKYNVLDCLQASLSYSQGYYAPQIFDEDLHIETSDSRQVIHQNDPNLKQETSHIFKTSLNFNKQLVKVNIGLLLEGFYTQLNEAFVSKYGEPDEKGIVIYTRTNANGRDAVQGINLELDMIPGEKISFKSEYTAQSCKYENIRSLIKRNS